MTDGLFRSACTRGRRAGARSASGRLQISLPDCLTAPSWDPLPTPHPPRTPGCLRSQRQTAHVACFRRCTGAPRPQNAALNAPSQKLRTDPPVQLPLWLLPVRRLPRQCRQAQPPHQGRNGGWHRRLPFAVPSCELKQASQSGGRQRPWEWPTGLRAYDVSSDTHAGGKSRSDCVAEVSVSVKRDSSSS